MGDVEHADVLALLFSLLGGFFMGAYPVPIKAPSVLKVDPSPIIFQCYKTFWVFASGWLFVLANMLRGRTPVLEFTWWGFVSAAAWIPSGLCTIAAVPRLGVGMAIAVSTGTASVLSFLVFWLVLGESMREHTIGGYRFYLAPVYLVGILIGMVAMVVTSGQLRMPRRSAMSPRLSERQEALRSRAAATTAAAAEDEEDAVRCEASGADAKTALAGLMFATLAGVSSAVQYGAVNIGKSVAARAAGCGDDVSRCSAAFQEEFDNFGSWNVSFGVGALLVTALYVAASLAAAKLQRQAPPKLHFRQLVVPGSLAGLLWVLGNFFQTAAVVRGGNAVMLPANQSIQLVTSGAFGLLYYREVPNARRATSWTIAALFTLVIIILLSREKAS
eukprot:TRINITY_DN49861_c0_g1_i1.p1 TRINITY_DN49861_c0_g1~~TRINITY_DN49861_c0_g1_i1.p1  ORF type:complete len:388 (+),score=84.69 TRINITY_DN49861_c0_g1_i1:53-1216(+)